TCRTFYCLWMIDRHLGKEWRPMTARMILTFEGTDNSRLAVHVDPSFPGRWEEEPYYSQIRRIAVRLDGQGRQLVVHAGKIATMVMPNKKVVLGEYGPDDVFITQRRATPFGMDWSVLHLRESEIPPGQRDA